jgi:UDP-N-acetylmuramate--alanine ligase
MILDNVDLVNKMMCSKQNLVSLLASKKIDVLLTVGAGDIDTLVDPIRQMLTK